MKKIRTIYFDTSSISNEDMMKTGVYKITNIYNNHFYIGSASRSFKERFKEHCRSFERWVKGELNTSQIPVLWNAFKKYNIESFRVDIIQVIEDKSIILQQEEFYINHYKPDYNICLTPTKGGKPNKGRKLSKEWKNNIRKQSKIYKHSNEILEKVSSNNKKNACKLQFKKEEEILNFSSWAEAANYFDISSSAIQNSYIRRGKYKNYIIAKLSTQRKKIKVNDMIFDSFNACDRYFDMWRGYTSTCVSRKEKILDTYVYEII